jgi:hypothetical protein
MSQFKQKQGGWWKLDDVAKATITLAFGPIAMCKPCFGEGWTKSRNAWNSPVSEHRHACKVCKGV